MRIGKAEGKEYITQDEYRGEEFLAAFVFFRRRASSAVCRVSSVVYVICPMLLGLFFLLFLYYLRRDSLETLFHSSLTFLKTPSPYDVKKRLCHRRKIKTGRVKV